jgi:hypothetical protein
MSFGMVWGCIWYVVGSSVGGNNRRKCHSVSQNTKRRIYAVVNRRDRFQGGSLMIEVDDGSRI